MRFYVLENGLHNAAGHHLNNSIGLNQALTNMGFAARFLTNRKSTEAVLRVIDAIACARFSPYDQVSSDPLCGLLENFMTQAEALATDMIRAIGSELCANDFLLVPTTTHIELHACALMLGQIPADRRPRLVLNFMKENFLADDGLKLGEAAALYRFAAKALAKHCHRSRVLLTANGSDMAESLSKVICTGIEVFPIPKTYPETLLAKRPPRADMALPIVGVFGDMNAYKGLALIPELVRLNPGLRWSIQAPKNGIPPGWGDDLEWMTSHPHVTVTAGGLDPDSYYRLFSEVDIVLTPYDPRFKRLQTSGIFAEAVASGKVVIAPSTAWVVEQQKRGAWAGTTFDRQGIQEISAALQTVLESLDSYKQDAANLASSWRTTQSVSAYVDELAKSFGILRQGVSV